MILIELNSEHYIIVDDSERKKGDWIINVKKPLLPRQIKTKHLLEDLFDSEKKITHSTQPIEYICCTPEGQIKRYIDCNGCDRKSLGYSRIQPLTLSEVKELLGKVDVRKKAEDWIDKNTHKWSNNNNEVGDNYGSFLEGYNQCLEDNKDKKYTEEQVKAACRLFGIGKTLDSCIKSIQPKTQWEVTFDEEGNLKLL